MTPISEEWDRKNTRRIELANSKARGELTPEEEAEFKALQEGFFAYLDSIKGLASDSNVPTFSDSTRCVDGGKVYLRVTAREAKARLAANIQRQIRRAVLRSLLVVDEPQKLDSMVAFAKGNLRDQLPADLEAAIMSQLYYLVSVGVVSADSGRYST